MIGPDCIGSGKSNYHTIMAMMAPAYGFDEVFLKNTYLFLVLVVFPKTGTVSC